MTATDKLILETALKYEAEGREWAIVPRRESNVMNGSRTNIQRQFVNVSAKATAKKGLVEMHPKYAFCYRLTDAGRQALAR